MNEWNLKDKIYLPGSWRNTMVTSDTLSESTESHSSLKMSLENGADVSGHTLSRTRLTVYCSFLAETFPASSIIFTLGFPGAF